MIDFLLIAFVDSLARNSVCFNAKTYPNPGEPSTPFNPGNPSSPLGP